MKTVSMLAALALVTTAAAGQPWTPSGCGARFEKTWGDFARALEAAKPGSPIYVARPFPRSQEEVVADWEDAYLRIWSRVPAGRVPEDEIALYQGIRSGSVRYEMNRVENWTPSRCLPDRQRDFFYLLRVRQAADGREIARAALNQNGLLSEYATRPGSSVEEGFWQRGLVPLARAAAHVQSTYGISAGNAQYVHTFGMPRCPPAAPCVALRGKQGRLYLLADQLYEIDPERPGVSLAEMNRDRGAHILNQLDRTREGLVTVGADRWVITRKIDRLP